jgi:2-polyprenyl-3-methyl-5-hydroxy-6-metoxy-1,4-benzoquinol methylase
MMGQAVDRSDLVSRARQSLGTSSDAIYQAVDALLRERGASGVLADVGCGTGNLWRALGSRFSRCIGLDAVRFDGLPTGVDFRPVDLDGARLPLEDGEADVVAAVETVEHLENPRAFCRELTRAARAGGWVVMTTPNQLSLLSLTTLVVKHRFSAFQDAAYPAHRTALLEIDLRRIARECELQDVEVRFTCRGRVPLSAAHFPGTIARRFPRALSDNVVLIGRRATAAEPARSTGQVSSQRQAPA